MSINTKVKFWLLVALASAVTLFAVHDAHANPLDDNCPSFVESHYPAFQNDAGIQYKCMKRIGIAYDTRFLTPAYVATKLTADELGGNITRGNFYVDPSIKTAKMSDYVGTEYDKGHLAEAELFTTDPEAMRESFCMCNMHAQWFNFNRGIWHALENHSHKLASQYGLVYIISGTVYGPKSASIGRGATVPDYSWKVISIPSTKTIEAYLIPNTEHKHEKYSQYKVNVREIEIATGLHFN